MSEVTKKTEEQRGAEAEVNGYRRELGPFVAAAISTRMAMVFTNAGEPDNPIIFANDSFLSLTGYDRAEVLGHPFKFLMARVGDPEALPQLEAAFGESSGTVSELRCHRKDGALFWAAIFVSPVRDEAGEVVQHFASFVDLTRHQQEEDHLRLLLNELSHRTQNTLATVQAIAAQTLRGSVNAEALDAFQERILALSKAHSLLGRENWLAVGLPTLIQQILQPFGFDERRRGPFSIEGEDVRIPPKAAVTLAMVFHELATNAAKYGALSSASGKVEISWQVEPTAQGEQMRLQWRERDGPPVTAPTRKGYGSRLIEQGLARELGGEVHLDYESAGVVCRIVMPLSPAEAVNRG